MDPFAAVVAAMKLQGDQGTFTNALRADAGMGLGPAGETLNIGEKEISLREIDEVVVLGSGKATPCNHSPSSLPPSPWCVPFRC